MNSINTKAIMSKLRGSWSYSWPQAAKNILTILLSQREDLTSMQLRKLAQANTNYLAVQGALKILREHNIITDRPNRGGDASVRYKGITPGMVETARTLVNEL